MRLPSVQREIDLAGWLALARDQNMRTARSRRFGGGDWRRLGRTSASYTGSRPSVI